MSERRPNVFGISRDLWDHPLFAEEPFTEREAWAWLIGAAAWKRLQTRGNVGRVTLERGEFSFAVRFLADKWQWDKSRVHRFIGRLIKNEMLQENKRDGNQVFSISNYGRFQVVGVGKRDADETPSRQERDGDETPMRQQRDKEETVETVKQGKQEEEIAAGAAPASRPVSVSRETSNPDLFETTEDVAQAEIVPLVTKGDQELEKAAQAYNVGAAQVAWAHCTLPLSDPRKRFMRARLAEAGGIAGWYEMLTKAVNSKFLRGENDRGWKPTGLDWFLKPANFTKIMEGAYDDPDSAQGGGGQLGRLAEAAAFALAAGDPAHRTG